MNLAPLLGNQAFTALAGTALVSAALFQLRAIPAALWSLLQDQLSASLAVYSEQEAFRQVDLWLSRHPSARNARRVALAEWWDQVGGSAFEMTPGEGPHLLWQEGRPIFVNRSVEPQAAGSMGGRKQTIRLMTIGRSRGLLERVIAEARDVQQRDVVSIHIWRGHGYELVERRPRRALETVYLAPGLRDLIVDDALSFTERRDWYMARGIPHRRGYLFEGPPGTGKSTMALALAGALKRSVYIINPSAVADDNALQAAINLAGSGLVLMEDIDAIHIGQKRATAPKTAQFSVPEPVSDAPSGISQSGLLNAIDGVAARDGRILVITSNHAEQLDPALVRPGRVDMRCAFGLAGEAEAAEMFGRFHPGSCNKAFLRQISPDLPLSQAEIQNRLLKAAA